MSLLTTVSYNEFENDAFEITAISRRGEWVDVDE